MSDVKFTSINTFQTVPSSTDRCLGWNTAVPKKWNRNRPHGTEIELEPIFQSFWGPKPNRNRFFKVSEDRNRTGTIFSLFLLFELRSEPLFFFFLIPEHAVPVPDNFWNRRTLVWGTFIRVVPKHTKIFENAFKRKQWACFTDNREPRLSAKLTLFVRLHVFFG
jgi:hypothetical protein